MPASLSVAPIAAAQIPAVGQLLAEAFDADPAYGFLFPGVAARRRGLADFFERNLRTHRPYRCSYVLTDGNDVVATVTIRPPGGVPIALLTMVRRGLIPFAMRNGPGAVRRLLRLKGAYDAIEAQATGGQPHRLVHMMAVAPGQQGRGIGTRLLQEAIALSAEAKGGASLPVVLTTHNERNVAFYRASGFTVTDRREVSLDKTAIYPVWTMSRPMARS
jgi:ribosomal protein S18 acetylase RimI-like enzyme